MAVCCIANLASPSLDEKLELEDYCHRHDYVRGVCGYGQRGCGHETRLGRFFAEDAYVLLARTALAPCYTFWKDYGTIEGNLILATLSIG